MSKSVHFADEEDMPQHHHAHGGMDEPEQGEFDPSQLTPSQRLQYNLIRGIGFAIDWGSYALKWGWIPVVALVGLTPVYCGSTQYPLEHLVSPPPQQRPH